MADARIARCDNGRRWKQQVSTQKSPTEPVNRNNLATLFAERTKFHQ
jgi:hypothetical protein